MSGLTVLAPLVILHGDDEKHHYLYRGALVGSGYNKEQVKNLIAEGMLGGEDDLTAPPVDAKPAGNASLEAWQEYARSQGKTDDDLADLGRDQVRDLFA